MKKAAVHNSYFIQSGAYTYLYLTTIACAYNDKINLQKLAQEPGRLDEKIVGYKRSKSLKTDDAPSKKTRKRNIPTLIIR